MSNGFHKWSVAGRQLYRSLTWKHWVVLPLVVIVLGFLLVNGYQGVQQFWATGATLDLRYLLLSLLSYLVGVLFAAWIWSDILKQLHGTSDYFFDVQTVGVSLLAKKVPGFIWEAVSRLSFYERRGVQRNVLIGALVVEVTHRSVAGSIAFGVGFFTQGALWLRDYVDLSSVLYWPVLLIGLTLLILLLPQLHRWLMHYLNRRTQKAGIDGLTQLPELRLHHTLRWVIGYVGVLLLSGLNLHFLMLSFQPMGSTSYWTLFSAFGLVVALGPLAMWLPGDIGVRDGLLFLAIGTSLTAPLAAALVLAMRLWSTLLELLFGGTCALTLGHTAVRRWIHHVNLARRATEQPNEQTTPQTWKSI